MANIGNETAKDLVERFDYHVDDYKRGNYNETQTRNDYINQFFDTLGWDVNNYQSTTK